MQTKNILLFNPVGKNAKVSVYFQDGTFWLTQKAMAELFGVNVPAVSKHLKNIFETGELDMSSTVSILETVQKEGSREVTRSMEFYRLEAILAVGYRVNSSQATEFRKWATQTLNEFIIKGFVMDDERLKQGKSFGQDYFDELLERIREIRASERRFYQKITCHQTVHGIENMESGSGWQNLEKRCVDCEKLFITPTRCGTESHCFSIPGFGRKQCTAGNCLQHATMGEIYRWFSRTLELPNIE